jgi:DNA invertase Pin-like site-specific DNA recombinase
MLADIEAKRIDCVVVYKVDRLSRSLLDFARIMEVFEKRNVSFVSVTQQMNTTTSMGRLTLNVLFSFAQFEREVISERTKDKMVAARRKGKWTGGFPPLGYDIDPIEKKLVPNRGEVGTVRSIFQLFVRNRSLAETLTELRKRGLKTKTWITRSEKQRKGVSFDRPALRHLLMNVLYVGNVGHAGATYPGEQEAIVDAELWQTANRLIGEQKRGPASRERTQHSPLLQGRLTCAVCGKPMTHGYTTKQGRRYRYYLCQTARKNGIASCKQQMISATRIEQSVLRKLVELGNDPHWPKLKEALRVHPADWDVLPASFQQRAFGQFVEGVHYDHATDQAKILLYASFTEAHRNSTVSVRVFKDPSGRRHQTGLSSREVTIPTVASSMALAIRFEQMVEKGQPPNFAELARRAGVSVARVSQIMKLRNLAPKIQESLLALGDDAPYLSELRLRHIANEFDWSRQLGLYAELFQQNPER